MTNIVVCGCRVRYFCVWRNGAGRIGDVAHGYLLWVDAMRVRQLHTLMHVLENCDWTMSIWSVYRKNEREKWKQNEQMAAKTNEAPKFKQELFYLLILNNPVIIVI